MSLQYRLIGAFTGVVAVALLVAGAAFVWLKRDDQERQALEQIAAASPPLYTRFALQGFNTNGGLLLDQFVQEAAAESQFRVLVVDGVGNVVEDSGQSLVGQNVAPSSQVDQVLNGGLNSWEPGPGAGDGLVLVSESDIGTVSPGSAIAAPPDATALGGYALVLGVPQAAVENAWHDLLPGLAIAAAVALPASVLLAMFLARQVTRPLAMLTAASTSVASGSLDVTLPPAGRDEVGRLSTAFGTMVERVGEARDEVRSLIAGVSHDLKTPLTSISGFARALETGVVNDPDQVRRAGRVLSEESERLSKRVEALLLLSEIESGHAVLDPVTFDIAAMLDDLLARLQPAFAERRLAVEARIDRPLSVTADPGKIERVLENLLENARKYAPQGSNVLLTAASPVTGGIRLTLANPFEGDADEAPRLFERFYRRDRSHGGNGTGLGLTIARDLVELHGGYLDAAVTDGEIVFTMTLPGTV